MRLFSKTAIVAGAGVVLLGTSLALSIPAAVSGASQAHSSGSLIEGAKKSGCDTSKYCLTEDNKNPSGGGISASGIIGVHAAGGSCSICTGVESSAGGVGVLGTATNSSASNPGYGVYGVAPNYGVYGSASEYGSGNYSAGVYGYDDATYYGSGVYGDAPGTLGAGVFGEGDNRGGVGVYGATSNADAYGIEAYSNGSDGTAFDAELASTTGTIIEANSLNNLGEFSVDADGNGTFLGTVTAAGFKDAVRRRDGARVNASVSLAPSSIIEDTGTARMSGGIGVVHLEPDFANTIDISQGYQVFLTPDGETRGWLYVAQKFEGGFIVREAEHGRSSVDFDYRVVAHPLGASEQRFPAYTPRHLTHLPKLPMHSPGRLPALQSR
jgi:hypothetical protein